MKKASLKKKKLSTRTIKIAPQKEVKKVEQDLGIPVFLEPTSYDVHDELARLDSYAYSRYNH